MNTGLRRFLAFSLGLIVVGKSSGQVLIPSLSRVFNNPTPEASEGFGFAVAALGTGRVVIGAFQDNAGAPAAGAAYLFSTNGTLVCTFTNPTPAASDGFGRSVAAVGSDKLVIGAYRDDTGATDAGAAYLFDTNGTLLTTFTNPSPVTLSPFPGENFGSVVAGLGTDKVLIGARGSGTFLSPDVGEAYLFSNDGTLITTFTNRSPFDPDNFGQAIAAVGTDRVLIGATGKESGTGIAYLFGTNGALLATFFNPTPAAGESFGASVAMIGNDKIVIGASSVGEAYLFNTNGTLLGTIPNPDPAANEQFGGSVAAIGTNKFLIGAPQDTPGALGVFRTGTVYLFTSDGTLLSTINNPTPESHDFFGRTLAAIGEDKVIIGAYQDNTGATRTGSTYLFSLNPTVLKYEPQPGGGVRLVWFKPATDYVLETTTNLAPPPATSFWNQVPFPYQTNGSRISVTVTSAGNNFYRLRH